MDILLDHTLCILVYLMNLELRCPLSHASAPLEIRTVTLWDLAGAILVSSNARDHRIFNLGVGFLVK